jgi:hypothetical protein
MVISYVLVDAIVSHNEARADHVPRETISCFIACSDRRTCNYLPVNSSHAATTTLQTGNVSTMLSTINDRLLTMTHDQQTTQCM